MPKEYNGHRSWNAWNVALWIGNDEGLYSLACECYADSATPKQAINKFVRRSGLLGDKTPDGATYNRLSIALALKGLELTCGKTVP